MLHTHTDDAHCGCIVFAGMNVHIDLIQFVFAMSAACAACMYHPVACLLPNMCLMCASPTCACACRQERIRDFQVETVDFKPTGRMCTCPSCDGKAAPMVDNVLDWDSPLPDDELDASIAAAEGAGVCLVLGSSLQISPANDIPLSTPDNGGKLVIINLQVSFSHHMYMSTPGLLPILTISASSRAVGCLQLTSAWPVVQMLTLQPCWCMALCCTTMAMRQGANPCT